MLLVECTHAVLLLWRLEFIFHISVLFEQAEQCLPLRHTLSGAPDSCSDEGSEKHTNIPAISKAGQYVVILNWFLVASHKHYRTEAGPPFNQPTIYFL